MPGTLIISLDFELMWGVRDHSTLAGYGANVLGVRRALPATLELFREYEVHATWATVGFVFFSRKDELIRSCPQLRPTYKNRTLDPYADIGMLGETETEDQYHFGGSLLRLICETPGQEIGSHTFSHYYCLEDGQDENTFRVDLRAAKETAARQGIEIGSLVFPRNQANPAYFKICEEMGIRCYRGTEKSWFYSRGTRQQENPFTRLCRLTDAYLNMSGHNTYALASNGRLCNLPSSRFLRPYTAKLAVFDPLRLRRITSDIRHAANHNQAYHLWWHPHNFGVNLQENLAFLRKVLDCFSAMRKQFGMQSRNMGEAAALART